MEKQQLFMKIAKKHYSSLYSDLNSDNESTGDKIFENLHLRGMLKRLFLNIPVIVLIVLVCA